MSVILIIICDKQLYQVAHIKCPELCNEAVLLNNRIQTQGINIFKVQS